MNELIIDSFAGGGGASTGIEQALGRYVDIAINHDEAAILMHKTNHPHTRHYQENIWEVDPLEATKGQPVGLMWASPDCKHFSKAKGGKPVDKNIRGLAWVVVKWAKSVKPRVIILENVEEFKTWGPLIDNRPDPERKGETFGQFVKALKRFGYKVDWRELRACDYGAPTIRKRFFLIARCDGKKIVWPEPTHGDPDSLEVHAGLLKPWRTAAECIDWNLPCPSIFGRKKPLVENTLARITRGIQKFVIDNPKPFIMQAYGGGYIGAGRSTESPLPTITTTDHNWLVTPYITQYHSYDDTARGQEMDRPLLTQDTSNRYGLAVPFLTEYYGNAQDGIPVNKPLHTVTTKDRQGLTIAHLEILRNHSTGQSATEPLNTICTSAGHFGVIKTHLEKWDGQQDLRNWPQIHRMLNEYCEYQLADDEILIFEIGGTKYFISDICMRMFEPRELFKAQGFPDTYIIDQDYTGKAYPKTHQVARCGNSVCPPIAEALVRVNLPEMIAKKEDHTG